MGSRAERVRIGSLLRKGDSSDKSKIFKRLRNDGMLANGLTEFSPVNFMQHLIINC